MSRAQDSSNALPISIHCKNCLEGFRGLCDGLGTITPEQALNIGFDRNGSHDFMQDAQSRFKAWAVNIAALQGAHLQSSLDLRLKEATEIRQRIVKILTTLNESLHGAFLIVNGTEPNEKWDVGAISDSDDDNASTPEETTQTSDLEQLFTAIKTANSSLMKLSMAIRNSPARDDYLKAASRYHFDARYDIGHVKEKHGAAKRSSDWLLERLGKAITRRRQYLKYREEHHTKLSRDWGNDAAEEVVVAGLEGPPMAAAKAIEDLKLEKTIALTKLTKATTYVENKTMIERDGLDLDQGSFGSQTSYEPTVVGVSVHKMSVPPPPSMAFEDVPFEYGEPFQCPYCYMEQTVKNKTAWKKHVFQDLKPYVCTFRECNLKMFRSRNEWFAHEIQNHRREWVCISCLESFTDKEKFSEHLQYMHSTLVAGSHLEALVLQCEEPVDKIPASGCLLCDKWESNLLDPKQDSKRLFLNNGEIVEPCGTLVQFRRHLGRHMEQLALFALPMADEDEMEDDSVGEGSDEDDDIPLDDKDVAISYPMQDRLSAAAAENISTKLSANNLDVDNQTAQQAWMLRTSVIHTLAIEPMTEAELALKLPAYVPSGTNELRQALQKVAYWKKFTSESPGKWHLKDGFYKELDVWGFPYGDAKERQRAIDNAIKQYDEMGLRSDEPQWQRLLPEADRGTGKSLPASHESITPPRQEITSNQVREDEIIALASIYGEDFRERMSSVAGWKSFDVRIKSSDEEIWATLEVILPATYPNAEPLLRIEDDDGLREETRKYLRQIVDTKPKELVVKGQPMIMEIVYACLEVLQDAVEAKATSKETGKPETGPYYGRMVRGAEKLFMKVISAYSKDSGDMTRDNPERSWNDSSTIRDGHPQSPTQSPPMGFPSPQDMDRTQSRNRRTSIEGDLPDEELPPHRVLSDTARHRSSHANPRHYTTVEPNQNAVLQNHTMSRKWDACEILDICSRLGGTIHCIGVTMKGTRCRWNISWQACKEIRTLILLLETKPPDSNALYPFLQTLAPLCLCEKFHQRQTQTVIQSWIASINTVSKPVDDLPFSSLSPETRHPAFTRNEESNNGLSSKTAALLSPKTKEKLALRTSHPVSVHELPPDASQPPESASTSIGSPVSVLIQRVSADTTEDTLRSMVNWSNSFIDATLLSSMKFDNPGFRSALLRFKTFQGALEAKNRLDGTTNPDDSAWMIVRILSNDDVEDLVRDTLAEVAAP